MSEKSVKTAAAYGLPVFSADTPITAESLNILAEGITSAMQNLETRLSRAGGKVNGPLEVAGSLTRAGNAVYDTGNKPTAADVGALSKNGDTATGRMTFSGNAEIYDGKKETYIELGKSGEKTTLEFHFGDHLIDYDALIQCYGNGDSVGLGKAIIDVWASELRENGVRVYSPNNKPSAADTGAVPGQLYYRGSARKTLVPGNYMIFNPASIVDNTNSLYTSGSFFIFAIVTNGDGKHRLRGMCDGTYIEYTAVEFSVENYEMVHDIFIYKLS